MKRQVTLGRAGIRVTRLGFGGIPIQRVSEREAVETVIRAIERGVDFIDTSRAYTTSERRIRIALRETGKKVVLATKSQQHSTDKMRKDVETSLKELQREKIELYQCHFIRDFDAYKKITSKGGALEGLLRAREEGLIEHIGITSHSLDLLDRVIVMKAFSGGVIDNPRLALKYALALEGTVVIPGVETPELFDENWEGFVNDLALSRKEGKEIRTTQVQFDKQFCRRCDYCQPCPEGIPIQHVIGIKSMVKRIGPQILTEGWPKLAIEQAGNCTECGECMERCPYGLPIPELIRENLQWVDEQLDRTENLRR